MKRFADWLKQASGVWAWIFTTAAILLLSYGFPEWLFSRSGLDRIKWAGLLFQWAGLSVVIYGLDEARSSFGRGRFFHSIGSWFNGFRSIFKKSINLTGRATLGATSSLGSATLITRATDLPVEEHLRRLQQQIDALESSTSQRFRDESARVQNLFDTEKADRTAGDAEIRDRLKDAMVGGINLELAGAAWLFIGITMTSIPEDIEKLFHVLIGAPLPN